MGVWLRLWRLPVRIPSPATHPHFLLFTTTPLPPKQPTISQSQQQNHCCSRDRIAQESSGRAAKMEHLWQQLFANPSRWWDNRCIKKTPKHPDFKHKFTLECLWLDCRWNPPGIEAKVAALDKVRKLCQEGHLKEAVQMVKVMVQQTNEAPLAAYFCLMKACAKEKSLTEGKQVHALMAQSKCDLNIFSANNLIEMYSKCGDVLNAHGVFKAMPQRNVFSWTATMSAFVGSGKCKEAIDLFQEMQKTGVKPDSVACVVALKACAKMGCLEQGKEIHSLMRETGLEHDEIAQGTLIDMYAKCGCLEAAREVFDNMSERNVVAWSTMIAGYAQNRLGKEALALYDKMNQEGVQANIVTFLVVLKACAGVGALERGKQIHSLILEGGFKMDVVVQSTLIDMYAKCGCLKAACDLFQDMNDRDVVSWNAMIAGYTQNGLGNEAFALYEQMKEEGVQANIVTFLAVLKACASFKALDKGKQIHSLIVNGGFKLDVIVQSALVDMYAKCGCLEVAREVFDNMSMRNVVSWNAIIAGYAHNGLGKEALALYEQMQQEGVQADKVTFAVVLKACASVSDLEQGKHIHSLVLKEGLASDVTIQNTLSYMYAKCGCLDVAQELFASLSRRAVVS